VTEVGRSPVTPQPSRQGSSDRNGTADIESSMGGPPIHRLQRRGAQRLLADFAALERITEGEGPSGRHRLELEVGCELADFLVAALARSAPRACAAVA
jgi:hypothetical protein